MKTNFEMLERLAGKAKNNSFSLIVAAAHDEEVIIAIKHALQYLSLQLTLIGNETEIEKLIIKHNITANIIHEIDLIEIGKKTIALSKKLPNPIIMKGLIDTKFLLKAVVDSVNGIKDAKLLSHVSILFYPLLNKTLIMTDGGMNINPSVDEKWLLIENAWKVAKKIGIAMPKIGLVSAVEKINPKIVSTTDAEILVNKYRTDKNKYDFILDGPFAIDNLVSLESVKHKNINSDVAGHADILIFPELVSGNVFYKTSMFLSNANSASVVVGAKCPIIVTSRADSSQTKLNSIILGAILVCA